MRWKPNDSIAVVTGVSSGIGRSLSKLLVQRGATVIGNARRSERLDDLVSEIESSPDAGGRFFPIVGDITDPSVHQRITEFVAEVGQGRLDLLVNNAGVGAIGRFEDASPERLRQIMEVNFFAPAELTRLLLPSLRRGRAAVICCIGSVLGHRAVPDKSEYCASKFALHGWCDALRAELKPAGIQITLMSPSTTRSEFFESLVDTDPDQTSASVGSWSPDRVARTTLAAIQARRSEVICSLGGKALVYADRISPPLMNAVLARTK
jgi:short-subunit dehydrogenase